MLQLAYSCLLAGLLAGAGSCLDAAACDPLPYEVYWNIPGPTPAGLNLTLFSIFPGNYTQTGDTCSTPGCKPWSQGRFPTINNAGEALFGGVPQNANLSAHLQALRETVVAWLPDQEWAGNAVLDFESWTTVWYLNDGGGDWHGSRYVNYSLVLEAKQHPEYGPFEVYERAKANFNTAATAFFVESLQMLQKLRPKAKWGFYGLPMNFKGPCEGSGASTVCGYDSILRPLYQFCSDEQQAIWSASSALFPSVYIPPFRTSDENAAYVRSVVKEAVRCAAGHIPVYAFHWNYYHNGTTLLDVTDLHSAMLLPYDEGARGVVIWMGGNNPLHTEYVNKYVGPMVQQFLAEMCECSQKYCSGHGRCMPSTSTNCECYTGYSGTHCEKSSL